MSAKIPYKFLTRRFNHKYYLPASILLFLIITELILRVAFGLGHPALMQADADTGYRFRPNQIVVRFGKKAEYNQYSQRSEPINANKPPGTLRILMIGDSVLNGGNQTDQKETITELLEARLTTKQRPVEVLNASASSWGIGNERGYIRKFGTLSSDAVILEISTHDLTQPTSKSQRLGKDPNYPTQAPLLALQEVWTRYIFPKLAITFQSKIAPAEAPPSSPLETDLQFAQNMQELKALAQQVTAKNIPFFVMFIPQLDNLLPTVNTPKYKTEFLQLCEEIQVPVIDIHKNWSNLPPATVKTYFRDNPHPNVAGNQAIADLLFKQLCQASNLPTC
jgi:lysophospholipase L1-like esterase